MNLEQSNSFMEEEAKKDRKKRTVIISIVICSLLVVLLFFCIIAIQYQDAQKLKMFINGIEVGIPSTLYKQIDGVTYVNVREMGAMLEYTYTQGEYNQYNEDETSCYLSNDFEIVTFTAEESSFVKYAETTNQKLKIGENIEVSVKSANGLAQKYSLQSPIKLIDGSIYAPFEALPDMFNAQADLSEQNRIKISNFERVITRAQKTVGKLGYTSISGDYENFKAMLYGLAVVGGDGTDYGVVSLTDGKEVIGLKYEDITFIPNLRDFQIKAGNTVGIFASDGSTVIKPKEYDEISVYDEEHQLYLVKHEGKYGILNRLGEIIIHTDYDQIGYNVSENNQASNAEYKIIFDKCIPVKDGTKYGLYSIEGTELLACVYDELGSTLSMETAQSSNEKPVFEIPPELGIKGIIINQNGMYGVFDITSETIIIPCVCTRVYSITKAAQTTYYLEYNGEQINLDQYLEANNLKNITIEKMEDEVDIEENTNTVTENEDSSTVQTSTEETQNDTEVENSTEATGDTETPVQQ